MARSSRRSDRRQAASCATSRRSAPGGHLHAREAAIVTYAQRSSRLEPITDEFYAELCSHFDTTQMMELCSTVGLSGMVNRFHSTFRTDVDPDTLELVSSCQLLMPPVPTDATV